MSQLWVVFLTVFLAELGDKTQLATLVFAAEGGTSPVAVFVAAAAALVLSTAIAAAVGHAGAVYLQAIPLKLIAGMIFVALGVWTIVDHFSA